MTVKGDLKLEIDEQGIEVRVTITPDEQGGEITPESLQAVLVEKKVRAGIDAEAVDRAFRTLARRKAEPVSFVAAAGIAPQPATPESVLFEPLPVPARLGAVSQRVLSAAPAPRGFRLREEKVRKERKVLRKGALPFLPKKEEVEVVFEKKTVREEVAIDPAVRETGFVVKGGLVARIRPGKQGKEGRSVFGRLVPPARFEQEGFLFCGGLTRAGGEVKAEVSGFLRKGDTWCDVVPFQDHAIELAASPDRITCLLTFIPGDATAPDPDPQDILARAETLGFNPLSLMSAREIEAILRDAIGRKTPLAGKPISLSVNGVALVTVTEDKLKAVLFLRKGRGGGKLLTPAAASDAIRTSRVRGFNADAVRKDLRAFFDGTEMELSDYVLAAGTPARPGSAPKIEWRALFLPAEEAATVRAAAAANAEKLGGLPSLKAFPPSMVDAVACVKPNAEVLKITPSTGAAPGVDVFGAVIPAPKGAMPDVRLFEGVELRRDAVVATAQGILEKGSEGMAVLLRVRPHRDAELHVKLSPDRMKAVLSFSPQEGDGTEISVEDVRTHLHQAGVRRSIDEKKLVSVLDKVARGEPIPEVVIAEGRPPLQDAQKRITFHIRLASGRALSFRADGRADFRAQDRITRVRKGELIATVRPLDHLTEDGWDVTGTTISPPPEAQVTLQPGRGVRSDLQTDGSTRFTAEAAGELNRDGPVLSVMDAHTVDGDVDMTGGNVSFPGNVRVTGSVRSGFTVVAGGLLEVEESVGGALLSSGSSLAVGQGIKGEGKAILRSKRDIEGLFAEQATLLAIGTVHLHGPCVRCQVKCNGKLLLDSEKGSLVGGEVRASRGAVLQNIGSAGGIRTMLIFGQDYLVRDQIEREEREVAALAQKVAALDQDMPRLERAADPAALARARAEKRSAMKLIEQRKLRLIGMRDKFDEHVSSEVFVRGTLFPGAILESHGRRYETRTEKRMITLQFDPAQGKIVEKL